MRLNPHPRYGVFSRWFADHRLDAAPIADVYYRAAGPEHATAEKIVSGIGANITGGRWNPPDVSEVVYASSAPETATAESLEHYRYYHIPVWEGLPKVMIAIRVELSLVMNLTDAAIAADFPEVMATLMAEDWRQVMRDGDEATSQAVGRAAFESGLQGLLVPSKPVPAGANLLVFPRNLNADSKLAVIHPDWLDNPGKPR